MPSIKVAAAAIGLLLFAVPCSTIPCRATEAPPPPGQASHAAMGGGLRAGHGRLAAPDGRTGDPEGDGPNALAGSPVARSGAPTSR